MVLSQIKTLTERALPPTRQIVQSMISRIAGKDVNISTVDRFIRRHQDRLKSLWSTGLDRNRHKADSIDKYRLYFELLHGKMTKYDVLPEHTYNMDGKRLSPWYPRPHEKAVR